MGGRSFIGYLEGLAFRRNGRISIGRDVGKRIPDEGTSWPKAEQYTGCLRNKQKRVSSEWPLARMLGRGVVVADPECNTRVFGFSSAGSGALARIFVQKGLYHLVSSVIGKRKVRFRKGNLEISRNAEKRCGRENRYGRGQSWTQCADGHVGP